MRRIFLSLQQWSTELLRDDILWVDLCPLRRVPVSRIPGLLAEFLGFSSEQVRRIGLGQAENSGDPDGKNDDGF